MTDEMMIELGRRAVACKGWRWLGGMRRVWPFLVRTPLLQGNIWLVFASDEDRARGYSERMPAERVKDDPVSREPAQQWDDATNQWVADIPDLRDPATLGCVLAMVREAHGKPAVPMFWGDYWQIVYTAEVDDGCASHEHIGEGDTEAEALVAALEVAP